MSIYAKHPMTSGIYAIRNRLTGRCYYGATKGFNRRCASHRSTLTHGKHGNRYLQADFDNTDAEFDFVVLEECSLDQLKSREQWYIAQDPHCYNILNGPMPPRLGDKRRPRRGWSRFTVGQVEAIIADNRPVGVIAEAYNCSHAYISLIKSGKRCKPHQR